MTTERSKYLDAKELNTLQNSAKEKASTGFAADVLTWAVVDIALQTGLRVNELAKLRVGDVDLNRGTLRVYRSKRRRIVTETIAMSPSLTKHMKQHLAWIGSIDPEASLWPGKRGSLTVRGLQQAWKRACNRAGLPSEISIHSARHTMAVHLLSKSKNLRLVQKQLGHRDPATTANMYADVPFDEQVSALTEVFG